MADRDQHQPLPLVLRQLALQDNLAYGVEQPRHRGRPIPPGST